LPLSNNFISRKSEGKHLVCPDAILRGILYLPRLEVWQAHIKKEKQHALSRQS